MPPTKTHGWLITEKGFRFFLAKENDKCPLSFIPGLIAYVRLSRGSGSVAVPKKKKKALWCGKAQLGGQCLRSKPRSPPHWTLKHLTRWTGQGFSDEEMEAPRVEGTCPRLWRSRLQAGLLDPGIWILTQTSFEDMETRALQETGLFSEPAPPV